MQNFKKLFNQSPRPQPIRSNRLKGRRKSSKEAGLDQHLYSEKQNK